VLRSALAVLAIGLVSASVSGTEEQPAEAIPTALPEPRAQVAGAAVFSLEGLQDRARPLGPDAPPWARRLYRRSLHVLLALTEPESGAMIAGEREEWDYVWPRDAAAGAIALEAAGLRPEARRVVEFLSDLDLDEAARFYSDGSPVSGRTAAGDGEGWVAAAEAVVTPGSALHPTALSLGHSATKSQHGPRAASAEGARFVWLGRQDYGENVTGDLLGNAIASGAPAQEVLERFATSRGLARQEGGDELDSSAAWAIAAFPSRGSQGAAATRLNTVVRRTLLEFVDRSTPYGIPPIDGWTPGEVWTAPTAWSAWALVELGETHAADRLLGELHRAESADGTLPERVSSADGRPTSTTPLAWSHAFAVLALLARYR
jgi:glucoamylase